MSIAVPKEVKQAAKLRHRRELDDIDYKRTLRVIREKGYPQRTVAEALGISQSALSQQLSGVEAVEEPREGFSGATALEVCQRYAAGFLGREQLIDELTRWPYAQREKTDGYDALVVDPPGTWSDVRKALRDGLIDAETYDQVLDRFNER
ncbi:hypothetical protein FEF26_15340 [Nesterenkonia salmonea]|uniref:Uncharacterized protein n=1 Tax=Nesterenkonia salmonea TaxID=1804987 RepID=A0A5R9B324_9MICC|nr:hypothetical protein [Nesterenkonia salmonea]TLP90505.1 hypothetical protein FEF26_15340 [Nesterenkonia salmonea]